MTKRLFINGILLICFLLFINCEEDNVTSPRDEGETTLFGAIEDTYDLKVHYIYSNGFFPEVWWGDPVFANGTQVDLAKLDRIKTIMETFSSKYSEEFIKENVQNIYLLGSIYLYNNYYISTFNRLTKSIYITDNGFTFRHISQRFHGELSSMLYYNYSSHFPLDKWELINPLNFNYIGVWGLNGQENLYEQTTELLNDGFLDKYSTGSSAFDFKRYSVWLFTRPNELKILASDHEKVMEKLLLVEQFYNDISAGITGISL